MQTFLPYPDFAATAAVLDDRRLGKQRVEALQVLRGLTVPGHGWRRHPAVRMWRGYEEALVRYGLQVCARWTSQGRADTCAASLLSSFAGDRAGRPVRPQPELAADGELPPWLGEPDFHRSHRSALVRKDPEHYAELFPGVPDDLPYVWPVSDRDPEAGA
ncbi:MSMEG_6728 family protein [Streptomyces sulfonofaciens]|nr:MSMEG_6728 family protein [Streptomyces sulfonofaciens]